MKRILSVLLVLAMALTLAACKGDDGLIHVGIISADPSGSAYQTAFDGDMQSKFNEARGYNARFAYADSHEKQVEAAQAMIKERDTDYLVICPVQSAGWETVLQAAKKARIQVILVGAVDADESLYAACVVHDIQKQGQTAVEWLAGQGLKKYKVIHLQEAAGSPEQLGRSAELEQKLKSDEGWSLVAQGGMDNTRQFVRTVIESGEKFNVIYAENDAMAQEAIAALDEAGISHGLGGDVVIVSFGCTKAGLEQMLQGYWNYNGQHNPFLASGIRDIIQGLEAGTAPGQKVVTAEDMSFDANTITVEDVEKYGI